MDYIETMVEPDSRVSTLADALFIVQYSREGDLEECDTKITQFKGPNTVLSVSEKSLVLFARPSGFNFDGSDTKTTFFFQMLTDERGYRNYAYILNTFVKNMEIEPVSMIIVSKYYYPELFMNVLLEVSATVRLINCEEQVTDIVHNVVHRQYCIDTPLVFHTKNLHAQLTLSDKFTETITGTDAYFICNLIGYRKVVQLVHALLTDVSIAFVSSSRMRLSRAQNALLSLIFPFVYQYTCVTVLPSHLMEILQSPSPFLIGVLTHDVIDPTAGYIVVDLDCGEIIIPDNSKIPECDGFYINHLEKRLSVALYVTGSDEDLAIKEKSDTVETEVEKDRKIRSAFMLYFAELLYGYSHFVKYAGMSGNNGKFSSSSVSFHVGAFRGLRRLDCAFSKHLLTSCFFEHFLETRAYPRTRLDVFDTLMGKNCFDDLVYRCRASKFDDLEFVSNISKMLSGHGNLVVDIKKSATESSMPIECDFHKVQEAEQSISNGVVPNNVVQSDKFVMPVFGSMTKHCQYYNSLYGRDAAAHQVSALRQLVESIFHDTVVNTKSVNAIVLALKKDSIRVQLCQLLADQSKTSSLLTKRQFDWVTLLVNATLKHETSEDKFGVVCSILNFANTYHRMIGTNVLHLSAVIQTCPIWSEDEFWSSCFYFGVHNDLFGEDDPSKAQSMWCVTNAANTMQILSKTVSEKEKVGHKEIFEAHMKHLIHLMVTLHVPVIKQSVDFESNTAIIQRIARTVNTIGSAINAKTCRTSSMTFEKVCDFVEARLDATRDACAELAAENISNRKKSLLPQLMESKEFLIRDPIECYAIQSLISDELPAKGCLYITNYRIVFKGTSTDPSVVDGQVILTMPIHSYYGFKKNDFQLNPKQRDGQKLKTSIRLKSNSTTQMKLLFDDQHVQSEDIDALIEKLDEHMKRKTLHGPVGKEVEAVSKYDKVIIGTLKRFEGLNKKKASTPTYNHSYFQFSFPKLDSSSNYDPMRNSKYLRYIIMDYTRTGLHSSQFSSLRMTTANDEFAMVKSYPRFLLVPQDSTDTELGRVAKEFVDERFPVVTYASSKGCLLIRSGGFAPPRMAKLKRIVIDKSSIKTKHSFGGSQQTLDSKASSEDRSSNVLPGYLESKGSASTPQINYIIKLVNSAMFSIQSLASFDLYGFANTTKTPEYLDRKALYVVMEKGHEIKIPEGMNVAALVVKLFRDEEAQDALDDIRRLANQKSYSTFAEEIEAKRTLEKTWMEMITKIMDIGNQAVTLMALFDSSVAFCLGNGQRVTTVLTSLVQVLIDPFYRTIDGFQLLIEKEWLSFGHAFNTTKRKRSVYMIMFLDILHQIILQYPTEFEYTQFFVKFFAFHSTSGYFSTFNERTEEERLIHDDSDQSCIFEFVRKQRQSIADFDNNIYSPSSSIITPSSSFAVVVRWNYFTETFSKYGNAYDVEGYLNEKNVIYPSTQPARMEKFGKDGKDLKMHYSLYSHPQITTSELNEKQKFKQFVKLMASLAQYQPIAKENKIVEHKLSPFNASIKHVNCTVCGNTITRWSSSVTCKKCDITCHEDCITSLTSTNGVKHFYDRTTTMSMPDAAIPIGNGDTLKNSVDGKPPKHVDTVIRKNPESPPVVCGYLSKRGAKLKLWIARYYVLENHSSKLDYYENADAWRSGHRGGSIDLLNVVDVKIELVGRRGCLYIVLPDRVHALLCETIEEANKWQKSLKNLLCAE